MQYCSKIKVKINKRTSFVLVALALLLILTQTSQLAHGQNFQWAVNLSILNAQNAPAATLAPFDEIQLVATVTYGNATQPNILVTFKVQEPTNASYQTVITRIEPTNASGIASFTFRLPIDSLYNSTAIGTWQASATIQTPNGVVQQSLAFTSQWNLEISSIALQNSSGKNQTSFSADSNVLVKLAVNNNGQTQPANVTINMQDSSGTTVNSGQIQNAQVGISNPTILQATLQIPKNATAGQATVTVELFSGVFNGADVPASQDKTVTFTITTSQSGPLFQSTISLFSWLLIVTGIFTFTSLTVFLRRKPYSPVKRTPQIPVLPATPAPAVVDSTPLPAPSLSPEEFLAQRAGLQPLTSQLSAVSDRAKRIEALETSLIMERAQLSKEIVDLSRALEEQEKAMMKYFDDIKAEMERIRRFLPDAGAETQKTENN